MRSTLIIAMALATLAGCGDDGGDGPDDEGGAGGSGGGGGELPFCERTLSDRKDAVCQAWSCGREDLDAGPWSGDLATCAPGDAPETRARALRLANTYRFLAGLPPVNTDPSLDAKAQQCAVMLHVNGGLSHNPPADWECRTADAVEAAGKSNIASGDAVLGVDFFMADFGEHNAASLGHRRWILSPLLETIGLGSTDAFSCMWVVHQFTGDTAAYTAWPPPGPVPLEILRSVHAYFGTLDSIGWSIQSNRIDLADASVTVTEDGVEKPVQVSQLGASYGSLFAIKIQPQGWESKAGSTYRVRVSGTSEPIDYEFEPVDCKGGGTSGWDR